LEAKSVAADKKMRRSSRCMLFNLKLPTSSHSTRKLDFVPGTERALSLK